MEQEIEDSVSKNSPLESSIPNSSIAEIFELDWSNPPSVHDLKNDFDLAQSAHNGMRVELETWRDLYDAKLKVKPKKGRSQIQPKLVRKQAEWRYAALSEPFLSAENLFETAPVTFEDKAAAEQNQLVLNYQMNNRINKVKFIDSYIRAAVDEGTVLVKTGWDFEEAMRTVEKPVMGLVPVQDPQIAQQMVAQGMQPVEEGIVGYEEVEELVTIKNHPTVSICELDNVVIDPTCEGDLEKANFVIYSYETSFKDLKQDGRYKNLDNINFSETGILSQPDHATTNSSNFTFKDKARKKIVVREYWGYWDINGDGTVEPILACYVDNTLIRLEENPYPDKKLPFVLVQYLPRRRAIYGEPDASLLEDNQAIMGAVTRGMIDLMGRSANSQQGIRKDALDTLNRRKFEEGEDYQFNANVDPRQGMYMHTYPEIPQSAITVLQMQNNEAESITGVKAFSSGISGQSLGTTATGVRSAMDATSKRELGILRRLADGIIQIGRKFMAMNAEFLDEQEVIRLTNEEFVRVDRKDLSGNIDIKLTISTAEADNEKAQELAFMLQTIGNNAPIDVTMGIMADIAKLRKMPDLAKRLQEYQPQPDPIAQERGMLELEQMRADIAYTYSRAEENKVDMETKMAKARHTQSQTDLLDIDFLDKQTGRDIQRQEQLKQADARSRMDEAAAKELLKYQSEMLNKGNNSESV